MTFAQPLWIVAGLIVCIGCLFLFHNLHARRLATLEKFAAAHLLGRLTRNVSATRQFSKKMILVLALFCCFLALARPQYGFRWEDVKRKGIDILFAVDTSKSMLAQDIKPNRLQRAKFAIMDFVGQLHGDRVGLLPFAGSAFLMCPLTGDYQAFETSLQTVDTSIIPKGGTDIAAAIREAASVLTNEANYKLLVLITDGENLEGDALSAAEEAAKKGVRIFTVGVGTREGEIIPISGDGQGFVKDASGKFVVSHLDEATLNQVAEKSDGLYAPLGNNGQGLQTIYQKKLALVPKEELTERRHKVPLERFQWPLAAAIGLLTLEFMIGTRKSPLFRLPFRKNRTEHSGRKIITPLVLLIALSLCSRPAVAFASAGEKAFTAGDYRTAAEQYSRLLDKHPDDPMLQFNFGTASYKNNKFDEALAAFEAALKTKDLTLQEKAYYNRGNAYFKKGEQTLQTNPQQTLAQWQKAVDSYSASLELQPDDQDALYNRQLVQKKLDELKKNEKEKENKQQQQEQDKQQQKELKEQDKQQESNETTNKDGQQEGQNQQSSPPRQQADAQQKEKNGDNKEQNDAVNSKEPEQSDAQQQADAQAQEPNKETGTSNAEARMDNERRKQGKMTKEDAEQLLNSLKNEEGKVLHFIPRSGNGTDDEARRDW